MGRKEIQKLLSSSTSDSCNTFFRILSTQTEWKGRQILPHKPHLDEFHEILQFR